MEFKVGDRVRAIAECDENAKIIGEIGTIRTFCSGWYGVEFDNDIGGHDLCGKNGHCWRLSKSKLEKVLLDKIIIITDGKTTTAKHYNEKRLIQSAEAKCSPNDTFDFITGAKIAFGRLIEKEKVPAPTVDEINIGDKVRIVDDGDKYPRYSAWIKENALEYATYYAYNDNRDITGFIGKVVAKGVHSNGYRPMLYLVQMDNGACYLMAERGIKRIKE